MSVDTKFFKNASKSDPGASVKSIIYVLTKWDLSQEYKVYLPLNLFTRIYHININKKKENM